MNIKDISCGTILSHRGETYVIINYIIVSDVEVKVVALCASKKLIVVTFVYNDDDEITDTSYEILTNNIMSDYSKLMSFVSKEITILTKS